MKEADIKGMFRKASNSVCTSTIVQYPDLLYPSSSSSSALKAPEYTGEDPGDHKQVDEGDIYIEYSYAKLYNASIGTVTKNYMKECKVGIDIV